MKLKNRLILTALGALLFVSLTAYGPLELTRVIIEWKSIFPHNIEPHPDQVFEIVWMWSFYAIFLVISSAALYKVTARIRL